MKKVFFFSTILCLLALAAGKNAAYAQTADEQWIQANELYAAGNFAEAESLYKAIESNGYVSADLYYNLGNAYFKQQSWGKAILYYERALRLNPEDKDIVHNLDMANAMIIDRSEAVPEFFLATWIRSIYSVAGADTWGWWAIVFFAACLLLALLFFFARSITLRKFSFFIAILSLLCCGTCILFAHYQKQALHDQSKAIVMSAVVTIKSSPDNSGKDLFILHEGTKVTLLESLGQWQRIQLTDGRQGWLMERVVEKI
ncbi:MAG: tetratricopeptide repeat protein [Bacteroidales bacterium]|nr:tetratricopeptide repeat protein [Bacteroidales bacterium]MCL2133872.1 tetratricopeptide repeat protein [Bacteroidales bacterium]